MTLHQLDSRHPPDPAALGAALAALPPGAPVVVMIHGYRFCPSAPDHDPRRHILSLAPAPGCWKAVSWPRHLGLAGNRGLALGWSWSARGSIWTACRAAEREGPRLAATLRLLRALDPGRRLHILAHSLGARVALAALPHLEPGTLSRLLLLTPAAFRAEAQAALATPGGRGVEVINVISRENALFDGLLRLALPLMGPTLGRGRPGAPGWADLALDRPEALARLAALGHRIAPPRARICHWSGYLRPGVWPLYRALLLTPEATPLALLAPPPARPARRAPLPLRAKSPS